LINILELDIVRDNSKASGQFQLRFWPLWS